MYPDNYSEKNNYTMQTGTTTTRDGQVQEVDDPLHPNEINRDVNGR